MAGRRRRRQWRSEKMLHRQFSLDCNSDICWREVRFRENSWTGSEDQRLSPRSWSCWQCVSLSQCSQCSTRQPTKISQCSVICEISPDYISCQISSCINKPSKLWQVLTMDTLNFRVGGPGSWGIGLVFTLFICVFTYVSSMQPPSPPHISRAGLTICCGSSSLKPHFLFCVSAISS